MPSRRSRFVAFGLALLVLVGMLLWQLRRRSVSTESAAPPAMAQRSIALGAASPTAAASSSPAARVAATQTAAPEPAAARMAQASADDYRRRARYPRWSQPLAAEEQDPIVRDRHVSRNEFPGPQGREPSLVTFPAQVSFAPGEPIRLYAYLAEAGTAVPAAGIAGTVADQQRRTLAQFDYHDDGQDGDDQAGDNVFSAALSSDSLPGLVTGAYLVAVRAVTLAGEDRTGATGFLFSRPDAHLTGRYTDAVADGNLTVQAEVAVDAAGRFHLEATLYGRDGQPLAWAQNALQLEAGTQWIPLTFFGLILHEKNVDGPYVLRYVALSSTTAMPNAKNPLVENAFTTQAYRAASFSDRAFGDPDLLDSAARLERDAAAARQANDVP